jgi:hypothetical protein
MGGVGPVMSNTVRVDAAMADNASIDSKAAVSDGPPQPIGGAAHVGPGATIDAATIRSGLGLTAHQLSEFTSALALDIGPRPNYPRYDSAAVHLMTIAQALRDVRLPLEVALQTVAGYQRPILTGEGWLACAPTSRGWLSSIILAVDDLTRWIHATGGRAVFLDLATLAEQAAECWERMRSPVPTRPTEAGTGRT